MNNTFNMAIDKIENTILVQAIKKLQTTIGIPIEVHKDYPKDPVDGINIELDKYRPDAMIKVQNKLFTVIIKKNLRKVHVGVVLHQLTNYPKNTIIITRYVTPPLADYLKEMDIPFIDIAGNAFINNPPIFIYIKGNKLQDNFKPKERHRAFQTTGLKVVYALLCNPGLENYPYRKIAKTATVALGTVDWVIKDLKQLGYILDMGKQGRQLIKKEDLLNRWITTYPDLLRPKQDLGKYTGKDKNWWKKNKVYIDDTLKIQWGGEIAAVKLTRYLRPKNVIIYTDQPLGKFILQNKLKKYPDGEVEILKIFWNFDHKYQDQNLVHPILIYADLVATADPRNIETAKIIYEQELTRLIRED